VQNRQRPAVPIETRVHQGAVDDQRQNRLSFETALVPTLEVPLYPVQRADHGPWPVTLPIAFAALGASVPQSLERLGDFLLDQLQ
jgi:hypothetical protein